MNRTALGPGSLHTHTLSLTHTRAQSESERVRVSESARERLQAPAVRAAHLEESWPAGEEEDGERERKEAPGASETKRVRPGTLEKTG